MEWVPSTHHYVNLGRRSPARASVGPGQCRLTHPQRHSQANTQDHTAESPSRCGSSCSHDQGGPARITGSSHPSSTRSSKNLHLLATTKWEGIYNLILRTIKLIHTRRSPDTKRDRNSTDGPDQNLFPCHSYPSLPPTA